MPDLITGVEINWTEGILTEITRRRDFNRIDVSIAAVSGAGIALQISSGALFLLTTNILVINIAPSLRFE